MEALYHSISFLVTTYSLGNSFYAVFHVLLTSTRSVHIQSIVIIVGSYMCKRIFSPGIVWFMMHMKLIRCFAFVVILLRTLSFLPISLSRHMENEILYFIITHVGYCDSSTSFDFCSSSLYPSIPSNPQFDSLPHCSRTDFLSIYPSDSFFAALSSHFTDQIQWNRTLFLRGSPELSIPIRSDLLHFVCFASLIDRIDEQQSFALRTAWHRKNLLDLLDREAIRHALYLCFSLSNRGVIANVPDMLLSKGSDAPLVLRALFRQCVAMAPSILVIDPLTTLTAHNPSRQIDLSPMDEAFLLELDRILEEARENGVTVIGVTIEKSWVQERILRLFDEQVAVF